MCFVLLAHSSVVLSGEVIVESKIAVFASEPPEDRAVDARYLIQGIRVAEGEQILAVRELVDRVGLAACSSAIDTSAMRPAGTTLTVRPMYPMQRGHSLLLRASHLP